MKRGYKMKKIFRKIPKKVKYTAGIILFLVLAVADAKYSQSLKDKENEHKHNVKVEVIKSEAPSSDAEVSGEEPEPSLETYEQLQDDYEKDGNSSNTTIEEIDDTINRTYEDTGEENQDSARQQDNGITNQSRSEDSVTNKGKTVIIDESEETMKDETKRNKEKEYDANQEPQGKIDWSKITPVPEEKGSEVNGDVPAGGKQGVGYW